MTVGDNEDLNGCEDKKHDNALVLLPDEGSDHDHSYEQQKSHQLLRAPEEKELGNQTQHNLLLDVDVDVELAEETTSAIKFCAEQAETSTTRATKNDCTSTHLHQCHQQSSFSQRHGQTANLSEGDPLRSPIEKKCHFSPTSNGPLQMSWHDVDDDDDYDPNLIDRDQNTKAKYKRQMSSIEKQQQVLQSLHRSVSQIESVRQKNQYKRIPIPRSNARWYPWKSWSLPRMKHTAYGVLSSAVVLAIRLYLDSTVHTAYLVHSIVVFFDMALIHVFTNSAWLSIGGEIVTYIHFMAFHFTKETLFELTETTLIAILCSFHLIISRNKHYDRANELEHTMEDLRMTSIHVLRHMESSLHGGDVECAGTIHEIKTMDHHDVKYEDMTRFVQLEDNRILNNKHHHALNQDEVMDTKDHEEKHDHDNSSINTLGENTAMWFGYQHNQEACKEYLKICGEHFYEHFLDGSAGVMYTSFLGLIITELVNYGERHKKC